MYDATRPDNEHVSAEWARTALAAKGALADRIAAVIEMTKNHAEGEADAAAKRFWQRSSWYRRANIHNESLAGQPIIDDVSAQGAVMTTERTDAAEGGAQERSS